MVSKSRLLDAFGELIYSVAIADGIVQPEEIETLKEQLKGHPWAREIQWSFDYELKKNHSLKDTYEKALETLKEHGPHEEYAYLVDVIQKIAASSEGIDRTEGRVISNFQQSLRSHFIQYLDEHGLMKK